MPITAESAHIDALLSNFAIKYHNDGFIADILSPLVMVDKRSDRYWTRNRRDVSHLVSDLIGPKGEAQLVSYDVGTANYSLQDRALRDIVTESLIVNADAPLNPRELATENIIQKLMLLRENRVATLIGSSGSYASGYTSAAGVVWSNEISSTPVADINSMIAAIPFAGENLGLVGWASRPVWNQIRKHPSILAMKGTDKGMVSRDEFAGYFELDRMVVTDLWKETANLGQTAVYSRMWPATVFGIMRIPRVFSGPDISAFSVTFRQAVGMQVRTWDTPETGIGGSETIQVEFSDDEVVVQNDMGYLLTGVL